MVNKSVLELIKKSELVAQECDSKIITAQILLLVLILKMEHGLIWQLILMPNFYIKTEHGDILGKQNYDCSRRRNYTNDDYMDWGCVCRLAITC